jgi:signal peptidase I
MEVPVEPTSPGLFRRYLSTLQDSVPLIESRTGHPRDPLVAALANLGGLGLGHVYSGQALTGLLLVGGAMLTMVIVGAVVLWLPPSPVVAVLIWLLPLAYTGAAATLGWRAARAAPRPFKSRWYNRWYWYLTYVSAAYVSTSLGPLPWIKAHMVEAFRVPSESMDPTVLPGEFLMVPRLGAEGRHPHRGAIVVCTSVDEPGLKIIKRVVGIADDTLAMRGGQLLRNGQAVNETYVRHDTTAAHADSLGLARMRAWQVEHFAGTVPASYNPDVSDWGPVVVPHGMLFVLGDNRDHSYDSRYYGFVPIANVRGQPRLVYWSFEPGMAPSHIRWSRFGHAIN